MIVPVAGAPSAVVTPASTSAPTFASVSVITPLTAAARSIDASSTTITLIVDGCNATGGVTPAATGTLSPTVAMAPTRTPSASSQTVRASSVNTAVISPTNGPAIPMRRAKARRSAAGWAEP